MFVLIIYLFNWINNSICMPKLCQIKHHEGIWVLRNSCVLILIYWLVFSLCFLSLLVSIKFQILLLHKKGINDRKHEILPNCGTAFLLPVNILDHNPCIYRPYETQLSILKMRPSITAYLSLENQRTNNPNFIHVKYIR